MHRLAERDGREILCRRYLATVIVGRVMAHLHRTEPDGIQYFECWNQLTTGEDFYLQAAIGRFFDALHEIFDANAESRQAWRPRRRDVPLEGFSAGTHLCHAVRRFGCACGDACRERQATDKISSFHSLCRSFW